MPLPSARARTCAWGLDECLNEFTKIRSDLHALLQPRPRPASQSKGKGDGKGKGKDPKEVTASDKPGKTTKQSHAVRRHAELARQAWQQDVAHQCAPPRHASLRTSAQFDCPMTTHTHRFKQDKDTTAGQAAQTPAPPT